MSLAAVLWKDVRQEARGKHGLLAGLVLVGLFMLLDLLIFPDLSGRPRAAAVVLWVPILYGGAALAGRGIASEADQGSLEWLRGAPVPWLWLGVSRTLVDGVLVALLAVVTALLASLLFGLTIPAGLWVVLLVAAIGIAVVGSLAGALAAQAQARGLLLPILLVPVLAPLLVAGVDATLALLDHGAGIREPLLLMVGYDVAAFGVAWLLWPIVLEGD